MSFLNAFRYDGMKNAYGSIIHSSIYQEGDFIYIPLKQMLNFRFQVINKKQIFMLETNEFMFYRTDGLLNAFFAGSVSFKEQNIPNEATTNSSALINNLIPYFFENIFIKMVGDAKTNLGKYPPRKAEKITKPKPKKYFNKDALTHTTGYGCVHLNIGHFATNDVAVIDTKKSYNLALNVGNCSNNVIFQCVQCIFQFENGEVQIKGIPDQKAGVYTYFGNTTRVYKQELSSNILNEVLGAPLGRVVDIVSRCYTTNPHCFEVYGEEGKLISPHEELFLQTIDKTSKVDYNRCLDIFERVNSRYCSQPIFLWSTMVASLDGKQDSGLVLDIMIDIMTSYRRSIDYSPCRYVEKAFPKLVSPTFLDSGVYQVYDITNREDFDSINCEDGESGELQIVIDNSDATLGAKTYFIEYLDEELTFKCKNEIIVAKKLSDDDYLLKNTNFVLHSTTFLLMTKHIRDKATLFIKK